MYIICFFEIDLKSHLSILENSKVHLVYTSAQLYF